MKKKITRLNFTALIAGVFTRIRKKIVLGLTLIMLSVLVQAQNGLENIIVEKYYISTSADSIGSSGVLPVGSVTYRIYVDMLPNYKFQMAYGNTNHNLRFTTTTSFFNNTDYGATYPNYSKTNARKNTVMLDSWLSAGAACTANFGVLKTEDNGVSNVVNLNGLLANTNPAMGIPLTTQDGLLSGSPQSVTFIGMDPGQINDGAANVFGDGTTNGNSFILTGSAWSSLSGSMGPTTNNRVLIAQITTKGSFHYELNIQIGTPTGGVQNYVSSNPTLYNGQMEITIPSLTGTFPSVPTVSITSPLNNTHSITGDVIPINAIAIDVDGNVTQVQFFVDGISKGIVSTAPYTVNYTGVTGTHKLNAIATDNDGLTKVSDTITLITAPNQAPIVNIVAPIPTAHFITGDLIAITANASDVDGTVVSVEFFVDGSSIGIGNTPSYTVNYSSVLGTHSLVAKATDDRGAFINSAAVIINVLNNVPPTVSITCPLVGASVNPPELVTINANATDADGSVIKVEFFINNIKIGEDTTSPYSFIWTSSFGATDITVKAYDDRGASSISSVVSLSFNRKVNLYLYLEGLFNPSTGMMNEAMDGNMGTPQWGANIADRIQVDLYNENSPYAPIGLSISDINLATNGLATFNVSSIHSGNYYIQVSNRNHLSTWSAIAVPFNTNNIEYDFTSDLYQAYGSEPQVQVAINPNSFAFYLGDLDQGGWIDAIDFNLFEPNLTEGVVGFTLTDFDGGGWVDAIDFNIFEPRLTVGNSSEYPAKKK